MIAFSIPDNSKEVNTTAAEPVLKVPLTLLCYRLKLHQKLDHKLEDRPVKSMIVTVGTGEGVEEPIAISIETANPDIVVFIVSEESRSTLDKVIDKLRNNGFDKDKIVGDNCPNDDMVVVIKDVENINLCYEGALNAFKLIQQRGGNLRRTVLDFTAGTKAMSAAAVLAAVRFDCRQLSYVGGIDRDQGGRVISGSEFVVTCSANRIARDLAIKDLVEAFNKRQFNACRAIIGDLRKRMSEELLTHVKHLENAVEFYDAWDRFDHGAASELSDKLEQFGEEWNLKAEIGNNLCIVCRIAKKRGKANNNAVDLLRKTGSLLMADIFANAERRAEEKRYDDAVARLYRLIELAAQVRLAEEKYGFPTSNVPRDFLRDKGLLEKYDQPGEKCIKVGLVKAYELLADLGDNLGKVFFESAFQHRLNARNGSILAHGLSPIEQKDYESLKDIALKLCCESAGKRFEEDLKSCRFPTVTYD